MKILDSVLLYSTTPIHHFHNFSYLHFSGPEMNSASTQNRTEPRPLSLEDNSKDISILNKGKEESCLC